jgi:hypothetical protein
MRLAWVVTGCLLLSVALEAQQGAQVFGLIKDPSDAVVPGATVTVVSQATGIRRSSRSNQEGMYVIASLQPGLYKVTARREGFQTLARLGVRFEVAQNARIDFTLQVGSMEQEVTVQGGSAPVNVQDGSVGMVIGRELIGTLPLNGRGLLGLLELAPGVLVTPATAGEAGQFTTNGQRANTNYFTLDGVSANTGVSGTGMPAQFSGGSLPGMTAFGSTHNLISIEALEEFRIETSSFAPEFGRLPGAQVVVSSRSGSNDFHGSLFECLRNQRLEANDWFANAKGLDRGPLRLNDFGAVLGGPVRRNRTFLFVSYEGLRLRQPYTWLEAVPSLLVRRYAPGPVQPILNAFPLPNGRDFGNGLAELTASTSRSSGLDAGSLRLDHALSARLSLFARYSRTPSTTESGYSQINVSRFRSDILTVGLTASFSPSINNELRLNAAQTKVGAQWRTSPEGGAIPLDLSRLPLPIYVPAGESFYRLSVGGVGELITGTAGTNSEGQFNLVDTMALTRGTHQLRFGGDYRRLAPHRGGPPYDVGITFESLADLAANQNMLVTYSEASQVSSVVRNISLFLQDTWRVHPRLTLTYGSRWELNPPSQALRSAEYVLSESADQSSVQTLAPGAALWRMGYLNFGPRIGVAYGLTRDGRTVLRAGAGVYYDAGFSAEADAVNGAPYNSLRMSLGAPYGHAASTMGIPIRYGVAPNLRLPLSLEWNFTLERALGANGLGAVSYVGSTGSGLLRREAFLRPDIGAVDIAVATNHGAASYNAFQLQYRRTMARGLQGILSYNWSHSIDTVSFASALQLVQPGFGAAEDRGSSSFDARHALTAAFSYEVLARRLHLLRGWAVHGMVRSRTGFPIDILTRQDAFGLGLSNVIRPDLRSGVPLWLADPSVPGGKRLNPAAFSLPHNLAQGTLGRNVVSGFGMYQIDLAVRRQFHVSDRVSLDTRIEAFNVLNHANFGDPVRYLASPLFGQSASMLNLMMGNGSPNSGLAPALQAGGPRSMQLALRLRF